MTKRHTLLKKLFITTCLVSISASASFAQDINAVGDRLKAALETQGIAIAWTGASGDASEMVLDGVTMSMAGTPGQIAVGQVTLSDITEENGAYTVGSVTLPDYSITEDGATIAIGGMELAGLKLGAAGDTDPLASMMLYDSADVESFSVTVGGKQAFAMQGAHTEIAMPADGKPMTFVMTTEGFSADLSLVEDPKSKAVIDALGYQTLNGNIELEGSWQPTDGRLAISQYDLTVDKAGTLGMTFDLGGYTPDFLKSMQEMQKKFADQPEGSDNSAAGLAMLGLMQQLTFHAASVRFDDDSLTGKVLDYVAKQQGMKASDIANQVKALAPIMLAQVVADQALIKNVADAVSAFLSDPKSLEVTAAPGQPVPFALIAAGAMSAPQELPKTLGVTVTANQD
ncbi:hypothetical protein [Arvimicrobium flavum]|uniref:hypothetical protein n=1 Tax=Arvimicrobium flavum TaxID=3393320 RepID=UPI00237BFD27|nr:hypothetical protein [Mesorhizobium shangrilense]